jgi:putative acetyltransferase
MAEPEAVPMNVDIREEKRGDREVIRRIHEAAFGRREEADIVDKLLQSCGNLLSLVAIADGLPVGHILFSPVAIEYRAASSAGPGEPILGMGLAPMAVLPEYQSRGIGSQLVREGLSRLRAVSTPFVIVLGHPDYYPRFGFKPASRHGIRSQWEGVPDQAFMILIFDKLVLQGVSGIARYREEFDESL